MFYKKLMTYWRRFGPRQKILLALLSFSTVFLTTYFMILPAITLEQSESPEVGLVEISLESTTIPAVESTQEIVQTVTIPEPSIQESLTDETTLSTIPQETTSSSSSPDTSLQQGQLVLQDQLTPGVEVLVVAPVTAQLPDTTALSVNNVVQEDHTYYQDLIESYLGEVASVELMDISLIHQGYEVEPSDSVDVTIRLPIDTPSDAKIVHFKHDGTLEILTPDRVNHSEISFEASSFSVFAIVNKDGTKIYRHTYQFQNSDGSPYVFSSVQGQQTSSQIVKDGETLIDVGQPISKDNQEFQGWFVYDETTGQYGNKITFNQVLSVREDKTVSVRPVYHETVALTLFEEDLSTIYTVLTLAKNSEGVAHVDLTQYRLASSSTTTQFSGWAKSPAGPSLSEQEMQTFSFSEDTQLYPLFAKAHKITFDTGNQEGAPVVSPIYLTEGTKAATLKPSDPVWSGKRFVRWLYNGVPFDFNQTLSQDITLTAEWAPDTTTVTIIYWQQSVTDQVDLPNDSKNYDFAGQEIVKATVDTVYSLNSSSLVSKYTGFDLNLSKSTLSQTVLPNGHTVLNVFYDRKIMTMQFASNWSANTPPSATDSRWNNPRLTTTFRGLYGTSLMNNGYAWPQSNRWGYYTPTGTGGMSFLGDFIFPTTIRNVSGYPAGTIMRFFPMTSGNQTVTILQESADGQFEVVVKTPTNAPTFTFTEKFTGFSVNKYEIRSLNDQNIESSGTATNNQPDLPKS